MGHSEISKCLNICCCHVPVSLSNCLSFGLGRLGRAPGITINLMKTCAGPSLPLHTCHARYYMYSGTGHSVLGISGHCFCGYHCPFLPFSSFGQFSIIFAHFFILCDPITSVPWSSFLRFTKY